MRCRRQRRRTASGRRCFGSSALPKVAELGFARSRFIGPMAAVRNAVVPSPVSRQPLAARVCEGKSARYFGGDGMALPDLPLITVVGRADKWCGGLKHEVRHLIRDRCCTSCLRSPFSTRGWPASSARRVLKVDGVRRDGLCTVYAGRPLRPTAPQMMRSVGVTASNSPPGGGLRAHRANLHDHL